MRMFAALALCAGMAVAQTTTGPASATPKPQNPTPDAGPAKTTPATNQTAGKPKAGAASAKNPTTPAVSAEKPTAAPKSFDLAALDRKADPCQDFYQFACGGWRAKNPIPGDQSRWSRFNELAEHNLWIERQILEQAANSKAAAGTNEQKIGDYYSACMDTAAINKKGLEPLKNEFDAIDNMKAVADVTPVIAMLHKGVGSGFFGFGSGQDLKDASKVTAQFGQGGLGLPNRDYYDKQDARSQKIREDYVAHLQKMFELMGDPAEKAAAEAKSTMQIESELAKASLTPVQLRDPNIQYHFMTIDELQSISPAIEWKKYFNEMGVPPVNDLNVGMPDFAKAMSNVLQNTPMDDIKAYLRVHLLDDNAANLPTKFDEENFNFFSKTLRGQKEMKPRWKRCTAQVNNAMGEALGKVYVDKTFGKEGKARTLKMVSEIEDAMARDLKTLEWMSPTTQEEAKKKLEAVANKIGFPDKWRDYSKLSIVKDDAVANSRNATIFENQRQLDKIGQPVDKGEWLMTPPTVNAYYDPQQNNINFPAGILQPPFYSNSVDDAVNYGAIGVVVGHELTHGFDDEGAQFDPLGNLHDWWTAEDKKAFEERTSCIANEYDQFIAVNDVHENGRLELGENTADNGGARLAFMAMMTAMEKNPKLKQKMSGFTPEQRFFLGFGQVWCENMTDQSAELQAKTNPHALGKYRVQGTVQNMAEFQKAWGCKAGDKSVSEKPCRVW
jgi:putative endopeptidase